MSPMFVPGPVDVAAEVLQQQTKPMMPHRSKDFEAIFQRDADKLRQIFFTQYRVFIMTNSGSGAQEAAVRNLSKERVLACVNGSFSKRWYDCAVANGKQADKLEVPMGQAVLPEMVAEAFKKQKYDLITLVHNETSTGVQNPVKEIAELVHKTQPRDDDRGRCGLLTGRRQDRDGCLGPGSAVHLLAEMPGAAARAGAVRGK